MNPVAIGARPIRQPDERSLAEALRITLLIFALATPFFAYMGLSANHVQEEYRLSRLVEHRRQLIRENERLRLSRDALLSPAAVSAAALDKLGMVDEDPQEWTLGVPPEKAKDKAGEPGSRRAGDGKKEKVKEPGPKKLDRTKTEEPQKGPVPDASGTASAGKSPSRVVEAVAAPKTPGGPEKTSAPTAGAKHKLHKHSGGRTR